MKRDEVSEINYRNFIENTNGFYIHRFDCDGNLILASPYIQKILGAPLDWYINNPRAWLEQTYPDDIRRISIEAESSFKNKAIFDQVYRIINREKQSILWVRTRFYPIFDQLGTILYFDGITFDITEQKEIEQRIISSERIKVIGDIAGDIAHNINNLLSGVMGNLQLLEMDGAKYLPNHALNQIQQALLASKRIAKLVKQMITFVRTGNSNDGWINLSALAIINRAIKITETFWKTSKEKQIKKIKFNIDVAEDIYLIGNIHELTTLFSNLIMNAIESIDDIGTVTIKGICKENDLIKITITDTGKGMKPEILKRSVEPLFSTKGSVGVGMGLSVAYGIAKKYKGNISISSKLNKGTIVSVILPRGYKEKSEIELKKETAMEGRKRARVLVIEDEPAIRQILKMFLEKEDCEVMVASSGYEGIEMFLENPSEVVFTDLAMAGVSGWEVAKKIKEHNSKTTVYLLTGWGTEIEKENEKMKYIDEIVYKPFDLKKLSGLLKRLPSVG